jgi:hypothetical protein
VNRRAIGAESAGVAQVSERGPSLLRGAQRAVRPLSTLSLLVTGLDATPCGGDRPCAVVQGASPCGPVAG